MMAIELQRHENSDNPAPSTSMPQIASNIQRKEIVEKSKKFTMYKIEVNNGSQTWIINKRYDDFVLLNKKLRRLNPQLRLNLPAKRFFKDNFDEDFIERRQRGLQEFTRNVLDDPSLVHSEPVQEFYRLKNPPQPWESLEASQNYCQSLERSLEDLHQQFQDQSAELNSVKSRQDQLSIALENERKDKEEVKRLKKSLEDQLSIALENERKDKEEGDRLKQSLVDQLSIALENERKAKEEVEGLKEEMRAERASGQAATRIEKQKRESLEDQLSIALENERKDKEEVERLKKFFKLLRVEKKQL